MIEPALTTEQQFFIATIPSALKGASKDELVGAYQELFKEYLLLENYRRVTLAQETLGVSPDDKYLQKFQRQNGEFNAK